MSASSAKSLKGVKSLKNSKDVEPWPRGVSREAKWSIGEVVERVGKEFPTLTMSKLRFLGSEGIVSPQRTASGYRKYSDADIERIRFCLASQRDSYLPLKVIRQNLAQMDAGYEVEVEPKAHVVASEGQLVGAPKDDQKLTARQIMDLTGISAPDLQNLVEVGVVSPDLGGRFTGREFQIIQLSLALRQQGVPFKSLRAVRLSAERVVDALDQIFGLTTAKSGSNREKTMANLSEATELAANLHTQLLRSSVEALR